MQSRRALLIAGAAMASLGWTVRSGLAALVPTPRQTRGPFYPVEIPLDADNDLVTVAGRSGRATGQVAHVFGRVSGQDGRPLPGTVVEIWQCDAFGRYHHPGDRRGAADPDFQGYGHMRTDGEGRYRFRTIRPVPYPGRTPHIHFAIAAPGYRQLVTQMYVVGEPRNARDGLYRGIRDDKARAAVTVALDAAPDVEASALAGTFDIVLADELRSG